MANLADVYVTIIPETRDVGLAVRKLFAQAQSEADRRRVELHARVETKDARRDIDTLARTAGEAGGAFAKAFRERSVRELGKAGREGMLAHLAEARKLGPIGMAAVADGAAREFGSRLKAGMRLNALVVREYAKDAARSAMPKDFKSGAKAVALSPVKLGKLALPALDVAAGAAKTLPAAVRAAFDSVRANADEAGKAVGRVFAKAAALSLKAGAGVVKTAAVGAMGGLALAGAGGPLVSITATAARLSGLFALLPAAVEGAAVGILALKTGLSGFGDAMKSAGDPEKFAASVQKLSPAAQQAAYAVAGLAPQFDQLKKTSQEALFAGLAPQITALGRTYLPILSTGFAQVNAAANSALKDVAAWAQTSAAVGDVSTITRNSAQGFQILGQAARPALDAFTQLGAAGSEFLPRLSQSVADAAGRFDQFVASARESGRITEWIDTAMTAAGQLAHALGSIGSVIATVFKAGAGSGGGFLGAISQAADSFNAFLKSAEGQSSLAGFFTGISQAASALAPILGTIAGIVGQTIVPALANLGTAIAPALNGLLQGLGTGLAALKPVFAALAGPLSQLGQLIGTTLAQAIPALAPAIAPLATAFVALAGAIAPILPVAAKLIGDLVSALAPALTTVFNALAPVVSQLMDALKPVLDALGPVLAEVAQQLAQTLAQAITELLPPLMPLVKSIAQLLASLLPILPAVVKIAAVLAGVLVEAIAKVLPLVVDIIKWFVDLATKISDVVVPIITKISDGFSWLGDKVKWLIDKIAELVKTVKDDVLSIPVLGDAIKAVVSIGGHATGGLIQGPGTGTSDSILARLSDGEYVMPAAATERNLPLLEALRAGWTPTAAQLHSMFPGFAEGGLVGGDDRTSRYVDAIVAEGLRRGLGPHEIQTALMTVSVETGFKNYANSAVPDSMAIAHDAVGSDHDSVGLFQQRNSWGAAAARMDPTASAGLFYDQLVRVKGYKDMDMGRLAQAVQRSAFPDRYATRQAEAGRLLQASMSRLGPDGALPATDGSAPRESRSVQAADDAIRNAQDHLSDSDFRLKQARERQQEVQANPKAKQRQRDAADHAVEVAERERAQAEERLARAQDRKAEAVEKEEDKQAKQAQKERGKEAKGHGKGEGSGPGGEDFGRQLGSGLLEVFGLDGSVLSNPFEWSGVKWLTGLVNRFTKPAQDQSGGDGGAVGADLGGGAALSGFDPGQLASFSPAQPRGADPAATTIDQSVNFNGPVGADPDETTRRMQDSINNRNRAFGLTAGRS